MSDGHAPLAEPFGKLGSRQELYAADVARQAVGVLTDQPDRVLAIGREFELCLQPRISSGEPLSRTSTTVAYRLYTALTRYILSLSSRHSTKCAILIHCATVVLALDGDPPVIGAVATENVGYLACSTWSRKRM